MDRLTVSIIHYIELNEPRPSVTHKQCVFWDRVGWGEEERQRQREVTLAGFTRNTLTFPWLASMHKVSFDFNKFSLFVTLCYPLLSKTSKNF